MGAEIDLPSWLPVVDFLVGFLASAD